MAKPRMTRAHFQLIADTVAEVSISDEDRNRVAKAFAATLRGTNDNFKEDRFLRACGVEA